MIVDTPDPAIYSAAVLMGRPMISKDEEDPELLAVVMKASYDLVADGAGPLRTTPSTTPGRSDIVFADEGELIGGDEPSFDVTYEADVALEKDRTDVVVQGFLLPLDEGAVVIGGDTWLTRSPSAASDDDAGRNLFGFNPRTEFNRRSAKDDTSNFANYYRRSGKFAAPGNTVPLPSGALVEIYQRLDISGDPDFTFRLPNLVQAIRYRTYCGHGPDEGPRWRIADLGTMRPDTLIIEPEIARAAILWRRSWEAAREPLDRYRKVQIRSGGF